MKIGLIEVDRFTFQRMTFPNLALMKISAWHKQRGDYVKWCDNPMERFDVVYQSKVFDETYSADIDWVPNAPKEIRRLQRWCNNRIIHGAVPRFEDYRG